MRVVTPADPGQIKAGKTITLRVDIVPADTLTKVRYYVDAILKSEVTEPPFDMFEWDTTGLQTGLHVVRIEAIDIKGQTGYAEVTQQVKGPPKPKPLPPPTATAAPVEPEKAFPLIPVIVIVLVVLAAAGGGLWWMSQKKKAETAAAPAPPLAGGGTEDIEDETMFMADFGDAASAPLATLSVVESMVLDPETTFEVTGRATVGRTDRNDINIPDKPVSRKHGEIYYEDNAYYIRDLGSRNGIRIDGKRISLDGAPLKDGAKIQLGPKTILQFYCNALIESANFDDKTKRYDG